MSEVGVIILNHEKRNDKLQRCLNMLRRQTYKDFEIFLMESPEVEQLETDDIRITVIRKKSSFGEFIKDVQKHLSGKSFLFCETSMVFAPDTLEKMVNAFEEGVFVYTTSLYSVTEDKKIFIKDQVHIFGKLFSSKILYSILGSIKETCSELEFLLCYIDFMNSSEEVESAYIYTESNKQLLSLTENFLEDNSFRWIQHMNKLQDYQMKEVVEKVFKQSLQDRKWLRSSRTYDMLVMLASLYPSNKEMHFYLTDNYIKKIYTYVFEGDEKAYECCQKYLDAFSKESKLQDCLLGILEIDKKQYRYMQSSSLQDYLFYGDKIYEDNNIAFLMNEIKRLNTVVTELENRIEEISTHSLRTTEISKWVNAKTKGDMVQIRNIESFDLIMIVCGGMNAFSNIFVPVSYLRERRNMQYARGLKKDGSIGRLVFHFDNNNLVVDSSDCVYGIRQVYGL